MAEVSFGVVLMLILGFYLIAREGSDQPTALGGVSSAFVGVVLLGYAGYMAWRPYKTEGWPYLYPIIV